MTAEQLRTKLALEAILALTTGRDAVAERALQRRRAGVTFDLRDAGRHVAHVDVDQEGRLREVRP